MTKVTVAPALPKTFDDLDRRAGRWAVGRMSETFQFCSVACPIGPEGCSDYEDDGSSHLCGRNRLPLHEHVCACGFRWD